MCTTYVVYRLSEKDQGGSNKESEEEVPKYLYVPYLPYIQTVGR